MLTITQSRFGAQDVPVVVIDGAPWVVLRPITELLGVGFHATYQRLRRAGSEYRTVEVDNHKGERRDVVVIPASVFAWWLLTVRHVPKDKEKIHQKLCGGLARNIDQYTTRKLLPTG